MADIQAQTFRCLGSLAPNVFLDDREIDLDAEFCTVISNLITNKEVELPEENVQSTRCNKSLEPLEIAYCCRQCETDPTCVLCSKCFEHSAHKNHHYRMITSAGGCCDCGDPEAWTDGVHCSLHQPKENLPPKEVNESPLSNLPNVILTRAPVVFRTLLQYCQVVLYWLSEDRELPQGLKTGSTATLLEKDSYHTLLYNDEVHSYDEVIYTLTENLGLGHVEAIGLTTSVDQVGRSLVMSGTKQECEDAKKKVNTNLGKPLQVMVLHSTVVAHQKCALQVLEYLEKLAHQSAGLCRLLSVALLSETEEGHSILDTYFLRDSDTWKGSASRWQSLILHSIFIDLKMKEDLGIALTRNYNVLLKNFNREQQVRDVSATALSVQLFTTPSLTRVLIVEHDLLSVLFGTIEDFFQSCVSDRGQLIFRGKPDVAIRIAYCTHDLRYVLRTQPPAESEWTPEFRDKFIRGFRMFLRLLNIMEDIDSVKRKRGRHVAREIEWEPALNMWCLLQPVVLMVVQWCQSDAKCLREAVKLTKEMCLQSNTMKFTKTEPFLVEYFVGEDPVSIHCPLPRLLAGLLTAAGKHNLQLSELLDLSEGDPEMVKNNLLKIMEKSLRCLVYCGQVHAGMWKRNGYSVLNQVFNYQYHFCQSGMYDKDLVMIKSAAALLEPYIFLHALIHKYRLTRWLEGSEDPVDGRDEPVDDAICYLTAEAEELVYLLIIVLGEHYFPGVGQVEMSHCLRRELIHTLYISPYSHNDLIKHHKHHEEKDLTPLLREVAEYERGSQSRKGMYKLKQEFEKEHTLFFYHYTRVDQSKAEDIQRRKVKSAGGPSKLGAVPPPVPPPLCEPYKGILRLIHSPVLWKILMQVFKRAISNSKLWSDKLLNESLYLCGIMLLQEEASGVSHFSTNAIEPFGSEEVSMLQVLEKLLTSQKAEEHRPLLTWIIQKLLAVQQSYMGTPVDAEDDTDGAKPKLPEVKSAPKQRSSVAAEKRRKIMEQMAKQQKNFLQKHKNELENIVSSPTSSSPRLSASVSNEGGVLCVVGLEALRHPPVNPPPFTCNICQGEGLEDHSSAPGTPILGAWVQRSAVMKRNVPEGGEVEDTNFLSCTLDKSLGIFANSCGHTMHYDCWKKYQDSKVGQEKHRLFLSIIQTVEWLKGEFLCPLCQFHCNTVLPLLPVARNPEPQTSLVGMSFREWLEATIGLIRSYLPVEGEGAKENEDEEMDSSSIKEVVGSSSRMPGPGCEQENKQKLSELFPKYLKLDSSEKPKAAESNGTSEFSQTVFTIGCCTDPNEDDDRVPVAMWNTCAFTMRCFEHSTTMKGKSILSSLGDRDLQHFEALIRTITAHSAQMEPSVLAKHCQYILNIVMLMERPSVAGDVAGKVDQPLPIPDILTVDPFMLLVNFHFAISALFNVLSEKESMRSDYLVAMADKFIVRLTLSIKILQFLSSVPPETVENRDPDNDTSYPHVSEEDLALAKMWTNWRQLLKLSSDCKPSGVETLYEDLSQVLQPFLQNAALFFHCVTGILLPEENSDLYSYLALPSNPCQLLAPESSHWKLVEKWCQHDRLVSTVKEDGDIMAILPKQHSVFLMTLPTHYTDVLKWAAEYSCGKVATTSRENTNVMLCLLCGQRLCSSSYCCRYKVDGQQLGAFSYHARSCGAGFGMGLWIMECQIVLMNVTDVEVVRGCFLPAPYLDEYGEPDIGLKNGRPLTLSKESQQELCDLWFAHEFAGRITKELEKKQRLLAFPWQRL